MTRIAIPPQYDCIPLLQWLSVTSPSLEALCNGCWDSLDKVAETLQDDDEVTSVHAKSSTTHHGKTESEDNAELAASP